MFYTKGKTIDYRVVLRFPNISQICVTQILTIKSISLLLNKIYFDRKFEG